MDDRDQHRPEETEAPARGDGRGVGRYSWMFLVAAIVALALGSWTLLVAILGLALLIFVHEAGHFFAAKTFRMRVERFYIGFPPAALSRTRGETEYGVGTIPLGGFCKISGMTPEEDLPEEVVPRAYYSRPIWQRNLTIFAGPLANFVAAAVILFVFYLAVGVPVDPTLTIDEVIAGSPAAKVGLVAGDTLIAADGHRFAGWDQAAAYLKAHPNQKITVTYRTAQGEQRVVPVNLTTSETDAGKGWLGVGPTFVNERQSPIEAGRLAVVDTFGIVKATFEGLVMLARGKIGFGGDQGAVGPVGIVAISSDAARQGIYPLLLAFISVNLGIMNLLPILPFDGGHIMINFAERLRRRRLNARLIEGMTAVGVSLVVAFFLYVTWNDIARLFD